MQNSSDWCQYFNNFICVLFSGMLGWTGWSSSYLPWKNIDVKDQISGCAEDNQGARVGDLGVSFCLSQFRFC